MSARFVMQIAHGLLCNSFLKECLADIELALSLDFPLTSEHKLYRRRACCLAQLGNRAGAVEGK